jgi:hypothetical protein
LGVGRGGGPSARGSPVRLCVPEEQAPPRSARRGAGDEALRGHHRRGDRPVLCRVGSINFKGIRVGCLINHLF